MSHLHEAVAFTLFVHDLFHPLRGWGYQFWSGIAGSFVLGGGIWVGSATLLRRHNCHVKGCMRIGRLPVAGTHYVVCNKHHPEGARTVEHIHQQYHRAKNEATGKRVLQANLGSYGLHKARDVSEDAPASSYVNPDSPFGV